MYTLLIGLATLMTVLIGYIFIQKQRRYGHMPGPTKLPLLGNLLQLNKKDHTTGKVIPLPCVLADLGKKYGDVMWIDMGITDLVVLSGYDVIYEALVKKGVDFADRPSLYRIEVIGEKEGLLGIAYNPKCKLIRNIFHQGLKVYGDGMHNLEKVICDSLHDLSVTIDDKAGQAVRVNGIIMKAFADMIYSLLWAHPIDEMSGITYKSLMNLLKHLNEGLSLSPSGILIDKFPFMRFLFRKEFQKTLTFNALKEELWQKQLELHKANWDGTEERCLVDVLLNEQKSGANKQSEIQVSHDVVISAINNAFNAGFTTSSMTLSGIMLVCLHRPDIQDKLYKEICTVIGATGQVSITHKQDLHYTRAVIFEGLRMYSVVPLGLFHKTSKDTSVGGYFIPKDTTVAINQWALHHDPDIWPDPWSFKPERFLDSDGSLLSADHPNRKRLLPFGAGERVCPGENFALNRLCLTLSTLVQRFMFQPDDSDKLPSYDPRTFEILIVVEVPDFKAKFIPRTHLNL